MDRFSVFFFCFLFLLLSPQKEAKAAKLGNDGIYIVYTGAASHSSKHDLLLSSLATREKNPVIHRYNNGFSGFAARLSEDEAQSMARMPGVVSVFPDPILQLHTTRSWDFLYQSDLDMGLNPPEIFNSSSRGDNTIIGVLDSGIWPESKAFDDKGMGPIPSRWKGTCMAGHAFHPSNCNRKLIGARYYADPENPKFSDRSPRDSDGHGTHVASIVAGTPIEGASFNGLAKGTAKGGSPGSRIAVYRVCGINSGCRGSNILKAFDDAIADGVDLLSISLGLSNFADFSGDPISIGAFHAVEKGILVVCSAGNGGGERGSVLNIAPWILTVGATTIDRDFQTNVLLGGNTLIKGGAIVLPNNIQTSPVYPLTSGILAKNNESLEGEASPCEPDSLDESKVKGKIVYCENYDWEEYTPYDKLKEVVTRLGGIGVILNDGNEKNDPSVYESPLTAIDWEDVDKILSYMNSTRNPVATILPTITAPQEDGAPSVALFSGRGPTYDTINIIKPDVVAPGVAILAAWPGNKTEKGRTSHFSILSGTSMACPHVSAIAAIVKSQNPTWSPSTIKSAIMTTAFQTNNKKAPIMTNDVAPSDAHELGSGQVSLSGPLKPGLVYETETSDYLYFLCNMGYNVSTIKLISSSIPDGFSCPRNSDISQNSKMNYPSISISVSDLNDKKITQVTRTLTNVGEDESVYQATLEIPEGLQVQVTPKRLQFTKGKKKLSYTIKVKVISNSGPLFGSITWSNGKYKVRSPLVID